MYRISEDSKTCLLIPDAEQDLAKHRDERQRTYRNRRNTWE